MIYCFESRTKILHVGIPFLVEIFDFFPAKRLISAGSLNRVKPTFFLFLALLQHITIYTYVR